MAIAVMFTYEDLPPFQLVLLPLKIMAHQDVASFHNRMLLHSAVVLPVQCLS